MYHQSPLRHALSMFHTIQDTSLKQIHKIHTFTHENLKHTILDLVSTMMYHQTLLQLICTFFFKTFPQVRDMSSYNLLMYVNCPSAACVCMRQVLMQPTYNLRKPGFPIFCNSKTFIPLYFHRLGLNT